MAEEMVRKSLVLDKDLVDQLMAEADTNNFSAVIRRLVEAQVNGVVEIAINATDPEMLVATGINEKVANYIESETNLNNARAELCRAQAAAMATEEGNAGGREELQVWAHNTMQAELEQAELKIHQMMAEYQTALMESIADDDLYIPVDVEIGDESADENDYQEVEIADIDDMDEVEEEPEPEYMDEVDEIPEDDQPEDIDEEEDAPADDDVADEMENLGEDEETDDRLANYAYSEGLGDSVRDELMDEWAEDDMEFNI